jgi:hypothetical protein
LKPLVEYDLPVGCDITITNPQIIPLTGSLNLKTPDFKGFMNFSTEYKMNSIIISGLMVDPSGKPKSGI